MSKLVTRRGFITGAAAASLLTGCHSGPRTAFLTLMGRWNERVEQALFSPTRLAPEAPASAITDEDDFPVYFISPTLPQAPANWALKVGGLITNPMVLTLDQLHAMEATEMRVQHHCVEGWSAVASWRGIRVSTIARHAKLDPRVRYVEFRSYDNGYWSGWDLASAMHPQTLIAYAMNGHPLAAEHGGPARLYSAIKLGYKSVKYLTEINFLPHKIGGYWEDQGYEWFAGV